MTPDAPRASSPPSSGLSSATSFALRLTGWSLALFGLFRLPWVGAHVFLPGTQLQAAAGAALLGPSTLPIEATLACSGADALALCLAAIVAYPAAWRARAAGAAVGIAAIVALNILRIGTLGRAAASPQWFNALHIYVWPLVLTVAIAAIVFTWMRVADGVRPRNVEASGPAKATADDTRSPFSPAFLLRFPWPPSRASRSSPSRRRSTSKAVACWHSPRWSRAPRPSSFAASASMPPPRQAFSPRPAAPSW